MLIYKYDILPNLKVEVSKKKDVVQKSLHRQPKCSKIEYFWHTKNFKFLLGYSIGFFENKQESRN